MGVQAMQDVEYVKDKELDVQELELESDHGPFGRIVQVLLKTNEGPITYKPYKMVDQFGKVNGFNMKWKKQDLLEITELPEVLWELNSRLQRGICKVRLSYFVWVDDGAQSRFLKDKQLEEMEFIAIEEKVENGNVAM